MNNLRKFLCKYETSESLIVRRRRQQKGISMINDFLRIIKVLSKTNFPMDAHTASTPTVKKLDIEMKYRNIYMSQYSICLLFNPRIHQHDV